MLNLRAPSVVQTLPVVIRDGKAYGRIVVTCGSRSIRIIAEGDQDLIEQVYGQAQGAPGAVSGEPGQADPELRSAIRVLVSRALRGDSGAVTRVREIAGLAAAGDPAAIEIYQTAIEIAREVRG